MAHASPEDVKKLAALARLSIPETDLGERAAEFDGIVSYIGQLEELAIDSGTPRTPLLRNVMRDDGDPTPPGTWTEKLTSHFPEQDGDHLSVKKIISYD